MNRQDLFSIQNYQVVDQGLIVYPINRIGIVPGDTAVVIYITPGIPPKKAFMIAVENVRDVAGNVVDPAHKTAEFYFNGFVPFYKTQINSLERE